MSKIYYNNGNITHYEKRIEEDVLILCNDQAIIDTVKKVVKSLKLDLIKAEESHDLWIIGAFCVIVDPDLVEKDFFKIYEEMLEIVNSKEFVFILTKPIKISRKFQKFFVLADSRRNFETLLRTTMLNRRSNIISRKTDKKRFSFKLNRLFAILRHLQLEGNYVKIPDLAKEFDVSEKTINRDLTYLREECLEDIRFDKDKKAYYLETSIFSRTVARFDPDFH